MKNLLLVTIVIVVMGSLVVTPVLAAGKTGPAGKSNVGHLYLYEKWAHADWEIVEGGAWGKMKYNLSGSSFDFMFNGHGLEPGQSYTLIYYEDPGLGPWTVPPDIICLGSGTANDGGNVHIQGSVDTGDLPTEDDVNYPDGAKIWLVLSDDVDPDNEVFRWRWNPTEYLFEYDLIAFDDTDE